VVFGAFVVVFGASVVVFGAAVVVFVASLSDIGRPSTAQPQIRSIAMIANTLIERKRLILAIIFINKCITTTGTMSEEISITLRSLALPQK
jgi:hypothetical protein